MAKRKIYLVDFNKLETSNYAGMSSLGKEIIDKMIELSGGTVNKMSERQTAMWDLVTEAMKELTGRQRTCLEMTYGLGEQEPLSEREIAKRLNISQQSANELKIRALNALRKLCLLNETVVKYIKKDEK